MTTPNEIDWSQMSAPAILVIIVLQSTFGFLKPILMGKFPRKMKRSKDNIQAYEILTDFVGYIEKDLTKLIGKTLDLVGALHSDVNVMKSEGTRTHNKVGQILATRGELVKEIELSINAALQHTIEGHVLPQIEDVKKQLDRFDKKLDEMKCDRQNNNLK